MIIKVKHWSFVIIYEYGDVHVMPKTYDLLIWCARNNFLAHQMLYLGREILISPMLSQPKAHVVLLNIGCKGRNFVVQWRHSNVKMTSVFFKMTGIFADCF